MTEQEQPPSPDFGVRKRKRRPAHVTRRYDLGKVIYGGPTGRFLLVEHDPVDPPPERLDGLERIGDLRDLIRGVGRGRNLVLLGEQLGFKRGTFNGYTYKKDLRPMLEPGMWSELVRLYFTPATPIEGLHRNQRRDYAEDEIPPGG